MDFSIAALLGVAEDASALANAMAVAWRVLIVLLGVNMLIIVHEWGHFIVARMCGVRCDKFYIWFDAYGFKFFSFKWGDTEYGLGWLPLGGYVKMLGQEDNPGGIQAEIERAKLERSEQDGELSDEEKAAKDEEIAALEKQAFAPDSYLAKNVFQRMAIISAGVFMNVVFAIVCATAAILIGTPESSARIGYVAPGSPAWKSGMQAGDEIVGIGDVKNPVFSSIIVATMDGKETNFDVLRPGADAPTTLAIQPRFSKGDMNPTIGVGPSISLDLAAVAGVAPFASSLDAQEAAQIEERLGALTGGERLVSMNGVPVETPADQYRLARLFIDRPIEYVFAPTVAGKAGERSVDETKEKIAVTIPPTGAPEIGVRLKMGEIVEIRPGSAAEKAGLRKREVDETGAVTQRGDVLLEINAEPILDPRLLPYRLFASGSK
ncbi:MAG: site-2 protease family protein, partial [Thermoguttaceae bacterium]|nr:site-2 protease family protein [Thermoguttaceae bacterium]